MSMVLFVIACVLLVVSVLMLLFAPKAYEGDYGTYNIKKWGFAPLVLGLVLMLGSSIYTQDPGEASVIRSVSGEVIGIDTDSGWGFKAPWASKVTFDIRNQRIEMFSNAGGEGSDGAAISCPLTGSSNASVSITVRYSIRAGAVEDIYNVYRSQANLRDNVLKPNIRDETRTACAEYAPLEIKERRAQLGTDIETLLTERWESLGVVVDGVDLGDIALDEQTEEAISRVNQANLAVDEAEANLERARVDAESTKTEAKAEADADQIIRCGAEIEEVTETVDGEERTTIVVTPKYGADCENLLNEQVLATRWMDTLAELAESGNNIVIVPNDPTGGPTPIINLPAPPQGD